MILLDKPYVSDLLKETIRDNSIPVVKTAGVGEFGFANDAFLLDEETAIQQVKFLDNLLVYSTSENAISWITRNLSFTPLPETISQFKNKAKFRDLIKSLYPDFYFREVLLGELENLTLDEVPLPFIIKPSVGFFSLGVHKVTDIVSWRRAKEEIFAETEAADSPYPIEVLDTATFIIEECIDGDEFAIDAYFNASGEPVILNILQHLFSSAEDVSDRVYVTSKKIVANNLVPFTIFLKEVGTLAKAKNFPVHVEIRRTQAGELIPIEINPLRFGGWCTTADLTILAYDFNPYLYFFDQQQPDWSEILRDKADKLYSVIVLDNSTGVAGSQIAAFNYDQLLTHFKKPLELRKISYTEHPVFGFLFAETCQEDFAELEFILKSDLREFITFKGE